MIGCFSLRQSLRPRKSLNQSLIYIKIHIISYRLLPVIFNDNRIIFRFTHDRTTNTFDTFEFRIKFRLISNCYIIDDYIITTIRNSSIKHNCNPRIIFILSQIYFTYGPTRKKRGCIGAINLGICFIISRHFHR